MSRGGAGQFPKNKFLHSKDGKKRASGAMVKNRASAFYYPGTVFWLSKKLLHKLLQTKTIMHNLNARKNVTPQKIAHTPPKKNGPSLSCKLKRCQLACITPSKLSFPMHVISDQADRMYASTTKATVFFRKLKLNPADFAYKRWFI